MFRNPILGVTFIQFVVLIPFFLGLQRVNVNVVNVSCLSLLSR